MQLIPNPPSLGAAESEARACLSIETGSSAEVPALESEIAQVSAAIEDKTNPLPPAEHDRSVADLAQLTAKLATVDIRRRNALRRRRIYGPVIAAEVDRLTGEIKAGLIEAQEIVRQRVGKVLAPHFAPEDLPVAVARSKAWRAEVAFQNGISTGRFGLRFVFDAGVPVLSSDCTPDVLIHALDTARASAEAVRNHLVEVKAAR